MKVKFNNLEEVKRFVNICELYEEDIDARKGRFIIDAKSFLGLLSIGIEKEFEIEFHSSDESLSQIFYNSIKTFASK